MSTHKWKKLITFSFIIVITFLFSLPFLVQAQTKSLQEATGINEPLVFQAQVGIPNFIDRGGTKTLDSNSTVYIAQMVKAFYDYGVGIAGILAAIMLMAGGLLWLTSAGNSSRIEQAKNLIFGSIIGLVLLFGAWMMLRTINPNLVDFKINSIPVVKPIQTVSFCAHTGIVTGFCLNEVCTDENGLILEGTICTNQENCVKKTEDSIFRCKAVADVNCCQYKRNTITGITCKTIGQESCPLVRNDNELDKVYEGVECNYQYNDSGRNPCVAPN
jgi:hypothetical protein